MLFKQMGHANRYLQWPHALGVGFIGLLPEWVAAKLIYSRVGQLKVKSDLKDKQKQK